MSYCVNCGVELAESEKYCPLCQTEVLNPRSAWQEPSVMPYPPVLDQLMRRIDRRYLALLLSTFLLVPLIVTLLSDWLSGGGLSWSWYVLGAGLLLWVWLIGPLLARRYHRLTFLALDCLAAMLYLYAIELIAHRGWFLPLALPISLAVSCLLLFNAFFFRQSRGRLLAFRLIAILTSVGLLTVVVELTVDFFLRNSCYLNWSPFVLTPCLILALALYILESKHSLKEEIRKRMFY